MLPPPSAFVQAKRQLWLSTEYNTPYVFRENDTFQRGRALGLEDETDSDEQGRREAIAGTAESRGTKLQGLVNAITDKGKKSRDALMEHQLTACR